MSSLFNMSSLFMLNKEDITDLLELSHHSTLNYISRSMSTLISLISLKLVLLLFYIKRYYILWHISVVSSSLKENQMYHKIIK